MSLHAQEASENQKTHQFWLDYNPKYQLSDRLDLKGSFGARTVSPNTWYRLWARPYLSYKRPKFILKKLKYNERLDGGMDIFYTANKDNVNRLELTPFQAYSLAWPDRERLVIRHYLKLEERFELETDDWNNTFGLRLSYEAWGHLQIPWRNMEVREGLLHPGQCQIFLEPDWHQTVQR
jgi:hypothetical protein